MQIWAKFLFRDVFLQMGKSLLGYILKTPGGVLSPKSYVDVPAGPRKSDYLYTNFLPNFPPISIPFSKEKHPIWIKLGAFYNNLPKIHPIYVIWAPSSLMKTPRSLYQISRKSAPKGRHIYVYHVNVRTPPGWKRLVTHVYNTSIRVLPSPAWLFHLNLIY